MPTRFSTRLPDNLAEHVVNQAKRNYMTPAQYLRLLVARDMEKEIMDDTGKTNAQS